MLFFTKADISSGERYSQRRWLPGSSHSYIGGNADVVYSACDDAGVAVRADVVDAADA
ncbi:hypothetical protein [Chitinophaga eiseniae]|uniref:Uncharacterized protein n=1 Tax=Chitinophaga eiseniae TaxID=634771 RepID=A0A847S5R4_9BACT|nr:hypothetical protein [Chitinophaga eiseniae]NLR77101.1 hypothetical protein [Chitinophaga eiseniae]